MAASLGPAGRMGSPWVGGTAPVLHCVPFKRILHARLIAIQFRVRTMHSFVHIFGWETQLCRASVRCVGPRRSVTGPALCVGPQRSMLGPCALCRASALCVGPGALCRAVWGPGAMCQAPALSAIRKKQSLQLFSSCISAHTVWGLCLYNYCLNCGS